MKELTKVQILEVMRYAGEFQREVFRLFSIDIIDVTKYKTHLTITVNYNLSEVSFHTLCHLFYRYFKNYKLFINLDGCYSSSVGENDCAHFELNFYV